MTESILLCAVGLLLIFLEFYLPGGIMGSAGALAVLASIALFAVQTESLLALVIYVVAVIAALIFLIRFTLWRIRNAKPGHTIYSVGDQEGYRASSFDRDLVGKRGVVSSDLKPGGHIILDKKRYAANSVSGYLSKGEEVIVIGGEGETLKVKREDTT